MRSDNTVDFIMDIVWIISGIITVIATTYTIYYFIRDYVFERKVDLPKQYITEYDILNDGNRIVRKTQATIKQRGRKIKGYEILKRLDQRWKIEGRVLEKNKISGHFESKSMRHTAYGTLFLEIHPDNVLRGHWLGYENVNNIINSGYYNLYPLMRDVIIKPMALDHIPFVIDIAEHTYGKNTISKATLTHYIEEAHCEAAVALTIDKTTQEETIHGFYLATKQTIDDINKSETFHHEKLPDVIRASDYHGSLDYLAVNQVYKNRGIGSKLLDAFDKKMKALGVNTLIARVKKNQDRVPLETGFAMRKFTMLNAIPTDENVHPGKCHYCENDHCQCEQAIFYKVC